jgi:hypothetical protein
MSLQHVATALQRVETVFARRPDLALHDDAPAQARWESGTRIVASHANGTQFETDMPAEIGGTGDRVTPGWLFRAGLASCAVTSIAMAAAAEGIELSSLQAIGIRVGRDVPSERGFPDSAAPPFAIDVFVVLGEKPQCDL